MAEFDETSSYESIASSAASSRPAAHIVDTETPRDEDPKDFHVRTLASVPGSEEAAKEALVYTFKTAAKLTPHRVPRISQKMAPKMKIPKHLHFRSLISCQAHLDKTRQLITNKLTENQIQMFRAHPLGRLIDLKFTFSGPLMHFMLLREIYQPNQQEIQFYIGGQVITFTYQDFTRIVGLPEPLAHFVEPEVNDRFLKVLLKESNGMKKKDLEALFTSCRVEDYSDDDMVRFALLFFIELVLMGTPRARLMSYSYLHILDDPVATVTYSWGDMLWRRLISGLQSAISFQKMEKIYNNMLQGKKSNANEKGPTIVGFAHAFQAWIYEQIPKLLEYHYVERVEGAPIPLLSWRRGCQVLPTQENLGKNIFKNLDKISVGTFVKLGGHESTGVENVPTDNVLAADIPAEVVPSVNVNTSVKRKRDVPECTLGLPPTSSAPKFDIGTLHVEMKEMRAEMHEIKEKQTEMQADVHRILMVLSDISKGCL